MINDVGLKVISSSNPVTLIIFKDINFKFPSFIKGRYMKESGVFIPHSQPFGSRFLKPENFFLKKGGVELFNQVLF